MASKQPKTSEKFMLEVSLVNLVMINAISYG